MPISCSDRMCGASDCPNCHPQTWDDPDEEEGEDEDQMIDNAIKYLDGRLSGLGPCPPITMDGARNFQRWRRQRREVMRSVFDGLLKKIRDPLFEEIDELSNIVDSKGYE